MKTGKGKLGNDVEPFPSVGRLEPNRVYYPRDMNFVDADITEVVKKATVKVPSKTYFASDDEMKEYEEARSKFEQSVKVQIPFAVKRIRKLWPNAGSTVDQLSNCILGSSFRKPVPAVVFQEINEKFLSWYNNYTLYQLVTEITELLDILISRSMPFNHYCRPDSGAFCYQNVDDLEDKWTEMEMINVDSSMLKLAKQAQISGRVEIPGTGEMDVKAERQFYIKLIQEVLLQLKPGTYCETLSFILEYSGFAMRISPLTLVCNYISSISTVSNLPTLVRFLALLLCKLKRLNRIILYSSNEKTFSVELLQELENTECQGWTPIEFPEWLLIQLELDVTIRSIQVKVARHMLNMPGGKHGVMQLNMGEGKTSVIVPMLVSTLSSSNQTPQVLCRVTVLNSIFTTNFHLLAFTIGGLLNKRVYTVPCRRDLNIVPVLDQIQNCYEECMKLGGVVLTLPEYRLSFRLQIYNKFLNSDQKSALKLHSIESWLRKNARDIVDESDEIFSVKYQLVYTTGMQLPIDGGNQRWRVAEKLLQILPEVSEQIFAKYGNKAIEFQPDASKANPEKFIHVRFLDDFRKSEVNGLIADAILDGKSDLLGMVLSEKQTLLVKEFLTNENLSEELHNSFLQCDFSEEKFNTLFVVSGYLQRGILFAALKKRWRVEYGVGTNKKDGTFNKFMAVPYRAKDVAAERTEFGHPDMAIILTLLSYYYSGLSDAQLMQCFEFLQKVSIGSETIYNSWIKQIHPANITSDTIKTYRGVNLSDTDQRQKHLFPALRKHTGVINFWLETTVFPKECKQFPSKLVANAWDLCYERNQHSTTGFSGTNDTSLLLPAQISQQDLDVLKETNTKMEATLLSSENEWKRSLKIGVSCQAMLQCLIEDGLKILIDAGAVMLELANEDIAKLWLSLDPQIQAVVYFDHKNNLLVKVRSDHTGDDPCNDQKDQQLNISPFRDRLELCAVYLDDQHTRGTDIRLPADFRACVTVGSGMRRDKLIQACMRMRKLGKGQSVHFYLSHEVHQKMVSQKASLLQANTEISVNDILTWVASNSRQFEEDGLVHWATNARNYALKLMAEDDFEMSHKTTLQGQMLANRCEVSDAQPIKKMYGTFFNQEELENIIPTWFEKLRKQYCPATTAESIQMCETVLQIEKSVVARCKQNIPHKLFSYGKLDEEQEKELEPEQEVEVQIERPKTNHPCKAELHENIIKCLFVGQKIGVMDGIVRISDVFKDTSIKNLTQASCWGNRWLASEDFIRVVQGTKSSEYTDNFLRPVRYFVSVQSKSLPGFKYILLLSQYEVNQIIHRLRVESDACGKKLVGITLHMFSARWLEDQNILAQTPGLMLPFRSDNDIVLNHACLSPLLIAAGNLFFQNREEEKGFADFLSLRLRPWNTLDKLAFSKGIISSSGFVLNKGNAREQLGIRSLFLKDTTEMVRAILRIRNEVVRDKDHVPLILERCAYLNGNSWNTLNK